jgi:dolichol-phosphate mannosyltransferase
VSSPDSARTLISIGTYNERENLEALLLAIHQYAPSAHVLVIDDNSPDGTGELADRLAIEHAWLKVMHRPGKLGLGTALLAAMHRAMADDYDLLVTMDADGSHSPRYLPALLAGMQTKDVMIGSRYVKGGGTVNWPASRQWISWAVNTLVRVLMRLPARDCSGGYRCYRVSTLRRTRLDQLMSHGYSFQEEVLYLCRRAGARIGETPIVFEDRRLGKSKANRAEMVRSLAVLLYLGSKSFFGLDVWEARRPRGNRL